MRWGCEMREVVNEAGVRGRLRWRGGRRGAAALVMALARSGAHTCSVLSTARHLCSEISCSGRGRAWKGMEDVSGRSWEATEGHGRSWEAMEDVSGRPWKIMLGPWKDGRVHLPQRRRYLAHDADLTGTGQSEAIRSNQKQSKDLADDADLTGTGCAVGEVASGGRASAISPAATPRISRGRSLGSRAGDRSDLAREIVGGRARERGSSKERFDGEILNLAGEGGRCAPRRRSASTGSRARSRCGA